jgi:competence protein ComEC
MEAVSSSFPSGFERRDIDLIGNVIDLPSHTKKNTRFRFIVKSVKNNEISSLVGQKIQLSCYRCPFEILSSQEWRLTVRLKRPHGYASWGAFDYEKYLFRNHLIAKGYVRLKGKNQKLNDRAAGPMLWRQSIRNSVNDILPNSVGRSMILALTIGDKSGFSDEQRTVFQNAGVSHLLAISGLHIGLVFMSVVGLLRWCFWPVARLYDFCPRPHLVLLPAYIFAFAYAALSGFAVSTQRALIMLAVYLICRFLARQMNMMSILILAATVLLIVDPFSVLDVGFWLSCGAVMIIAAASKDDMQTSLLTLQPALWLGMMPMSIVFFGKVSLVSPLVNLVAVPLFCLVLIPVTLIVVALCLVGMSDLASPTMPILELTLNAVFNCLELLSSLSIASWFTTPFMWWQWGMVIVVSIFMMLKLRIYAGGLSIFLLLSVLINPVASLSDDELQIVLLDVGQGLAMIIETPNSITVYDTGPRYSSGFTAADAVLLPYLRRRGVKKIDTLIISHADNDHIGGYQVVADAFKVKRLLTSRVDKLPNGELCSAGQSWQFDKTHFSVVSPDENTPQGSNNLSCVLKIRHQGTTVLLTGDIEKQVERYLVRSRVGLTADILLVPHQGSKTSSTAVFLDAVAPKAALLAAGYKNHYGHPHLSVVERYQERSIKVFSTIESGSVLLKINSRGWRFIEYRQSERRIWFD